MRGKRHLFLTGARQVGKSTLLRALIARESLACAGFETKPLCVDGERRGFIMHGLVPMPPFVNDCVISVRLGERRAVPVLPAFEENGVEILRRSLASDAPFLLMDELGRLERDATAFATQVKACLDSSKRVLGVLQRCDAPLMAEIATREDVLILTVTPENRIALLDELVLWAGQEYGI